MSENPHGNRIDGSHITDSVSPELIELMFDSTSDGIFAIDADYRLIAINGSAERTLGVARAEVIGKPCHRVLRANICRECCALRYAMETGEPVIDMAVDLRDAEDRRVPVAISCNVLRDRNGRVIGGVETFRNLNWVRKLVEEVDHQHPFASIVTEDAHMRHIFEILPTIANSDSSVLVHGETGTGKNLIAKAIHNLSPRRRKPYVTVNCGALPETLLESELFGYRAGAFTDAVRDRRGRIAAAEGGTLFLDEIGDMPASAQVKLLRFLQDRTYERLGDDTPVTADVRVITATNRNLSQLVDEGVFRRDLYYRINVMNIELPPLRDRSGDIPLLVRHFLEKLSLNRRKHVTGLTPEALEILRNHDYPGNIRELENIVEHAFVLCPGATVELGHLPERLRIGAGHRTGPGASLEDLEARFILDALARNAWNRQATARELGIHRTTLLRRIRRLGLELPDIDGRSAQGDATSGD